MIMEDFYIKCNSKEESELCSQWAETRRLSCKDSYIYTESWCYFIVKNDSFIKNGRNPYNLPQKSLEDIGIMNAGTPKQFEIVKMNDEFRVGDWVIITERPSKWSSKCNEKCPIHGVNLSYPIIDKITKISNYPHDACEISGYGWDLNVLKEENKIRHATPEEIAKVTGKIEESKFIVGKWYKINNCWYAKFKTIHNSGNCWQHLEVIDYSGSYRLETKNLDNTWKSIPIVLLEDLSEIQQYLPEGHVDKISNTHKSKFEVGDIVDTNNKGWQFCDIENYVAINSIHSNIFKNQVITDKAYSTTHKNWWYKLEDFGNWYSECALEKHVDKVCSDSVTTSPKSKSEPVKYDLSTTITRAVKANDPSIIIRESGKSIDELCRLVDESHESCSAVEISIRCPGLSCYEHNCPFYQFNGKTKESAKAWLRGKSKQSLSDYEAVHVDSQEKWDFVSEKLGYTSRWVSSSKWGRYKKDSCINLEEVGFGTEEIAYSKVISFEDWLDLTGYTDEWYSNKKGNDLDIGNSVFKKPLIFEECIEEKPEFSLFQNFVSKIN